MNNFYLVLLFFTSLLVFIVEYNKTNSDLADPVTGVFMFFTISLFFSMIGNFSWGNYISGEFYLVVIVCFIAIVLGGYFGRHLKVVRRIGASSSEMHRIDISNYKIVIVVGATVILSLLYVIDIVKLGNGLGAIGLSTIVAVRGSKEVAGNFILRQGIKITMAAGYVNSFIFVNNAVSREMKRKDFIYLIPTICGCICAVFTGVRTEIFRLLLAIITYYCVLSNERQMWRQKNKTLWKIINKGSVPIAVFLGSFFGLRTLVKVSNLSENKFYNFIQYLEFYVGSSWIVLNEKIRIGLSNYKGKLFGEYTLAQLWADLKDFGMIHSNGGNSGMEFVLIDPKANVYGNVATMFKDPLVDFGVVGTFIFLFFLFLSLSVFYNKHIQKSNGDYRRNKNLVIYAFFYYIVGLSFYSDIFSYFLSVYFMLTLLLIVIIYAFYFKIKIKRQDTLRISG